MSLDDPQIISEFVEESREHLADIENQLLSIEAAGADIDVQLIDTVFRAAHSIKGASGFLGFTTLAELTHYLENILNLIRNRELIPTSAIVDVLLRAADVLSDLINNIAESNGKDISVHVEALKRVAAGESVQGLYDTPAGTSSTNVDPSPTNSVDIESNEEETAVEPINEELTMQPTNSSGASKPMSDQGNEDNSVQSETTEPSAPAAEGSIRVPVSVLDRLMNLAGELVLGRNQLIQTIATDEMAGIESVSAKVDQVTSELQEAIMQTRMQQIGNSFSKFPRVIRDLSAQLGKQCDVTIKGKEVELDKSIIESIGDPLTHLVRNSVDHGIESPAVREAAGKPAKGKILLQAFHQAGKVNITIRDDGAGIDTDNLKEKAVAKGIITKEKAERMSQREAMRLIFHPGFSMAAKLTDVSGRGVGMDVVKTNIEGLGGTVDVDSEVGTGTTIHVKLPLTLAIIPSMIVLCGKGRYAIPQVNISELVRIKPSEVATSIERIKDAEVLRLRGDLLPLVRLSKALRADALYRNSISADQQNNPEDRQEGTTDALNIIVVEAGQLHYGLVVDGLFDSEEIVVKPLGKHMRDCPCLSGATLLGDGQVALILDISGIATHTNLQIPENDDSEFSDETTDNTSKDSQAVLLFTNHPSEHFGLPMSQIARIERIRSEQVDSVGGQQLLQYRSRSLPLLSLEHHINAKARPDQPRLYVAVTELQGREVGIIVPNVHDVQQFQINQLDTVTMHEPGVLGSYVLDKTTIRLIDSYDLAAAAHPDWFENRATGGTNETNTATILLAEDSDFFRNQVTSFLESSGYQVVACADGQIAWNTLKEMRNEIDLVVTDIEMPNMNGFELCRNIKDDNSLSHLSVIALTSLAGDADIQRGKQSGIDDYQVKMDRDKLLAATSKFLLHRTETTNNSKEHLVAGVGS